MRIDVAIVNIASNQLMSGLVNSEEHGSCQ